MYSISPCVCYVGRPALWPFHFVKTYPSSQTCVSFVICPHTTCDKFRFNKAQYSVFSTKFLNLNGSGYVTFLLFSVASFVSRHEILVKRQGMRVEEWSHDPVYSHWISPHTSGFYFSNFTWQIVYFRLFSKKKKTFWTLAINIYQRPDAKLPSGWLQTF